uniref:Retroactive n=1 Tax=Glyphodes pyloalis TaxID=1242752 RepID=A0A6G7S6M1_GLYPY|nr:retroactive [Glyphodes pyloalis]
MNYSALVLLLFGLLVLKEANCLQKRCIRCRSRGEAGSCRDPFPTNVTETEAQAGIHVVACPSGWCAKLIQGTTGAFRSDDYGAATQRMCLQRSPNDDEERCAYTMWNHKKVYMCFCNGDLCNSALRTSTFPVTILLSFIVTIYSIL